MNASSKNSPSVTTTTTTTTKRSSKMNTMFSKKDMSVTATIHGEPEVGFSGKVYIPFTGMYYKKQTAERVLAEHGLDFTLSETEELIDDIDFEEYDILDGDMRTYGAYVYRYETFLGSEVVFIMGPNVFKGFASMKEYELWRKK